MWLLLFLSLSLVVCGGVAQINQPQEKTHHPLALPSKLLFRNEFAARARYVDVSSNKISRRLDDVPFPHDDDDDDLHVTLHSITCVPITANNSEVVVGWL